MERMRNLVVIVLVSLSILSGCGPSEHRPTDVYLTVESEYGSPTPSVGDDHLNWGMSVTASVDSPLAGGPGTRYVCTGWTGAGSVPPSGSTNSFTFLITQNSSITWNWKTQYELTISVSPPGLGAVTCSPEGAWQDTDTSVQLTAVANTGCAFINWSGDLGGSDNPQVLTMDGPKSVTAHFHNYTIYVSTTGDDVNDGLSWATAVRTIQKGIDLAGSSGWTVLVANGTYTGANNKNLDFKGKAIYLKSVGGAANCIIDCERSGRGFYLRTNETANSIVDGFTILNGSPSGYGGGIYCFQSSPAITNCKIVGGSGSNGGGIACYSSNATISNCVVTDNSASEGGGIWCYGSNVSITNCAIIKNEADTYGGGIRCSTGANPTITNCTIAGNAGTGDCSGGGIYSSQNSSPVLNNCAIWGNKARSGYQIMNYSSVTLRYCDYANGTDDVAGTGTVTANDCVNVNPQFVDTVSRNYRLRSASPCINAGNDSLVPEGATTDLDGNPRIINGAVDIGAYEYSAQPAPVIADFSAAPTRGSVPLTVYFQDKSTGSITSWAWDFDNNGTTDSTLQNPQYTYATAGTHTVRLTVTGPGGSDTQTKVNYITVRALTGNTIYVDGANGDDEMNNGLSWAQAVKSIQRGLDLAGNTSWTVSVAKGIYTGPDNRDLDFKGKELHLRSAGGATSCIIDCQQLGRGFYFHTNETANSIVEGFTIRNGKGSNSNGGGIYCVNASPVITACIMTGCLPYYEGGAMACEYSYPIIMNCTIEKCRSALYARSSGPILANCTIANNTGAIRYFESCGKIIDCRIMKNDAGNDPGGGISCYNSILAVTNCIIEENKGTNGGGINCYESSCLIANCLIANNRAGSYYGGGIDCYCSDVALDNCTITGNEAPSQPGDGICCNRSDAQISNTIIWGNVRDQIYTYDSNSTVTLNYCAFANGSGDVGGLGTVTANNCVNLDPQFVDAMEQDYHLLATSPCVDAGDNSLVLAGVTTDLEGRPRITNGRVNIGAYEGAWLTMPGGYGTIQAAIDAATDGDGVLVADGIYKGVGNRDLDFKGKVVHLRSASSAANCIIDCENSGRGFHFHSGETAKSRLEGVSIKNGNANCGGGIYCSSNSSPSIAGCTIASSAATNDGGGIHCSFSSPEITNCLIAENRAQRGGGIALDNSAPLIVNCAIADNTASTDYGGGILCWTNASPTVTNCTIVNNSAGSQGAGIYCWENSSPAIGNTIIWGNHASSAGNQIYTYNASDCVSLRCCNYADGANDIAGSGTVTPINRMSSNPQFVDAAGRNYRLLISSPCIDAGDNSLVPSEITTCLDDNPRITGDCVNIGAYEGGWFCVPGSYPTIQSAIDVASDGDGVLVADGTYTETGNKNLDFKGKAIYLKSVGGATNCIIDCENFGRGFYFHTNETPSSVIDGFTIRNGRADGGGGICCYNCSPRIINCIVTGNVSTSTGGGLQFQTGRALIENCTVSNNTAQEYGGGGIYCYNVSRSKITNCTITGNIASGYSDKGGGFSCSSSRITITNCAIESNIADDQGGGLCLYGGSYLITDCTIVNNTSSTESGGGIYAWGGTTLALSACAISNNRTSENGGGICWCDDSSLTMTNCLVSGNITTTRDGGGIFFANSGGVITNCTVVNNTSTAFGGGISCGNSNAVLNNVILWGNSSTQQGCQINADWPSSVTLNYCDYANGVNDIGGIGTVMPNNCINLDPLFIDAGSGNYRLQGTSQCIDAGDDSLMPAAVTSDLDGSPRIVNGAVDIGAYECQR
jgi:parallel beta-helix repeat protein